MIHVPLIFSDKTMVQTITKPLNKPNFEAFTQPYLSGLLAGLADRAGDPSRATLAQPMVSERSAVIACQPDAQTANACRFLGVLGRILAYPCWLHPLDRCSLPADIHLPPEPTTGYAPILWYFTPSLSFPQRWQWKLKPDWGKGIYDVAPQIVVVVLDQLPTTPETIWLRLMGERKVQAQAIADLSRLPLNHPQRRRTIGILATIRINLTAQPHLSPELQEIVMNLTPAYEKWRRDTLAEGREVGHAEGEQKGRQQEREELTMKLLQEAVDLAVIARITGFAIEHLQQVRSQLN
jgi:hypothetical protein